MTTVAPTASHLFEPLAIDGAPEAARPMLEAVHQKFSFIPNMLGLMANAPPALTAYLKLDEILKTTSFSHAEQQLILLAASVENGCAYCQAAHSTALAGNKGVPGDVLEAARNGSDGPDLRFNALTTLVREIVAERGHVGQETIDAFLNAGYQHTQILEILVGVAMKTISNYTDHISPVEVDAAFAAHAADQPAPREKVQTKEIEISEAGGANEDSDGGE